MLPDLAYIKADNIQIKCYRPFQIQKIFLKELIEINYHYHAVVGFVALWEFLDKDGNSIDVSPGTLGLKQTLRGLENNLSGFSLKNFDQMFKDGDVQDILNIWKSV